MQFYDQKILSDPENDIAGDCYRACLASFLKIPYEHIPHFAQLYSHDMFKMARLWLINNYRIYTFDIYLNNNIEDLHIKPETNCLIFGKSPRQGRHSVIGKVSEWNLEILHDPHPSRAGLLDGPKQLQFFHYGPML